MPKKTATKVKAKTKAKTRTPRDQTVPMPTVPGSEVSVEVRKIENGYLTEERKWSKAGKFSKKEFFSEKKPEIKIAVS